MSGQLPDFYFRVPENGALVFRVDTENRAVDYLNLTTQWAQAKASDEQLEAVTEDLLLAMHDLRSVLVRKKEDRSLKGR